MERILGISTGVLYKLGTTMHENIKIVAETGCNGIELGYVGPENIIDNPLSSIDHSLLEDFSWVSIHAPGSNFKYGDNKETEEIFKSFEDFNKIRPINLIVFHPDSFDDISILKGLNVPIGIENMDKRKANFQFPNQLEPIFDQYANWGMVLDVNHCFTNDPTMQLAEDLKAKFLPRIKQIHLSGYSDLHDPLCVTNQDFIIDAMPKDVPIIIESTVTSIEQVKKEFQYITNYLNK